jgi:formate hydrogenlyase subunit 4
VKIGEVERNETVIVEFVGEYVLGMAVVVVVMLGVVGMDSNGPNVAVAVAVVLAVVLAVAVVAAVVIASVAIADY